MLRLGRDAATMQPKRTPRHVSLETGSPTSVSPMRRNLRTHQSHGNPAVLETQCFRQRKLELRLHRTVGREERDRPSGALRARDVAELGVVIAHLASGA